ncbi:hypothetical protein F4810DRAFT_183321 [Camillea tinctor]|nr:hypothetical protein F4810DRAFT_183321 [Camillea tinctor]
MSFYSDSDSDVDWEDLRSPSVYSKPPKHKLFFKQEVEEDFDPLYHNGPAANKKQEYDYQPTTLSKLLILLLFAWLLNWATGILPSVSLPSISLPSISLPRFSLPRFPTAATPTKADSAVPGSELFAKKKHPLTKRYQLNFTSEMAPFWGAYREILASPQYDGWFTDVDEASAAIGQLVESYPKPINGTAEYDLAVRNYARIMGLVKRRHSALDLARTEYANFLAARGKQVREMLGSGSLWQLYVEDRFKLGSVDNETAAAAAAHLLEVPSYLNGTLDLFTNATYGSLTMSARRLAEKLVYANRKLWKPGEMGLEVIGRAIIHVANSGENELVPLLLAGSPRPGLWTDKHAKSMGVLVGRMERARAQYEALRTGLEWFFTRFTQDVQRSMSGRADLLVWVQSASEIVKEWASLLVDTQEGLLISLRREELAKAKAALNYDYEKLWEDWKLRNCGGTSCYDVYTKTNAVKRAFGKGGKPLASVAEDEKKWSENFEDNEHAKIWPEVYEKGCCEDGPLQFNLKYGEKSRRATI